MYPTTSKFKTEIYGNPRTVVGKVTFDISDVTAIGDITSIVTTAQASISNKDQLANKVRDASANLATWERNRFRLDGSFSFPDDTIANNGEMGFVSSDICDAGGVFSSYPTITFSFGGTHSSAGITITFDRFNNEYAVDFDITAYNGATVIQTVSVVGNTEVMPDPLGQLANYNKIVITIKKWSVGYRRARVLEVDFGIVRTYTDDSLIGMKLIEELDLTSARLPSPEFDFTVDNSDRAFNILNPTGFYKYLQQRQQVIAELGLDVGAGVIEWVPLGNYLLWDWTSDEGSLTATFTARTNLDLMAGFDYEQLTPSSKTLYALAEQLFAACGIENYSIDPALQSIATNSMAEKTNCRDALQMVAIAGCANIFVTRGNVITLKCLTLGAAADTISLDDSYDEPKIVLEPTVRAAAVTYWTDLDTSAVVTVNSSTATVGDVLKLERNTFINSSVRATAVGQWLLERREYRAEYRSNWRGNPAHELGDVIEIENSYGANMAAFITKNDIRYAGYLSARTDSKGAVN
ncbi:hypothetical protein [Paenibacillus sp.]|uniref:hypothetical protein n=1 Tax=Paenibacillus sp. TaxID=58172 RepID=UPI002D68A6D4|nr:hypothetical protein [Paenibacillus sp.]HZG83827.1 hypothetical protein [Paenibacillus sp.]